MTLLSWDATSSLRPAFEKRRTKKTLQVKVLSTPYNSTAKQQAQRCLSRSQLRHKASTSADVYKALVGSGIFSKTSPDTVSALSKQLEPERFEPGRVLGARSGFSGRVYVIISGKVKVSYRLPDGFEIILTILGPSEIFGAITLFDPDSQETSVTALTEVLAAPIEHDQLLVWITQHPEVGDQVLRLFARSANAATNSLVDFAFADAQKRIASRLLFLRQRFGRQEGDVVRVVHDLTLKDFARLVGVPPNAVLTTLRNFESRGWIRLEDNSVVIVDGQALASLSPMSIAEVSYA